MITRKTKLIMSSFSPLLDRLTRLIITNMPFFSLFYIGMFSLERVVQKSCSEELVDRKDHMRFGFVTLELKCSPGESFQLVAFSHCSNAGSPWGFIRMRQSLQRSARITQRRKGGTMEYIVELARLFLDLLTWETAKVVPPKRGKKRKPKKKPPKLEVCCFFWMIRDEFLNISQWGKLARLSTRACSRWSDPGIFQGQPLAWRDPGPVFKGYIELVCGCGIPGVISVFSWEWTSGNGYVMMESDVKSLVTFFFFCGFLGDPFWH